MGPVSKTLIATELFAISQGSTLSGKDKCHWCGGDCERSWPHDEPPAVPFKKSKSTAKFPNNKFICHGCWLWRRQRVTVWFMDKSYKDSQSAVKHSWYITSEAAVAIRSDLRSSLYPILLRPPNTFCLTLLSGDGPNHIHQAEVNDIAEIKGETELKYTLDNVVMTYSVYELETALRQPEAGRSPGIRALIDYCGAFTLPIEERKVGRPTADKKNEPINTLKKEVTMSGGGKK